MGENKGIDDRQCPPTCVPLFVIPDNEVLGADPAVQQVS